MDKKIVVPDGMLKAACEETSPTTGQYAILRDGLEAALRWLSENPILPPKESVYAQYVVMRPSLSVEDFTLRAMEEWQRVMFSDHFGETGRK